MQTINKTQYQCAELRRSVPVLGVVSENGK